MGRIALGSLAVITAVSLLPVPLAARENAPLPGEEWQIKGILAALQDGYPQVRERAAKKLAELLQQDASSSGHYWGDNARKLITQATPVLFGLTQDRAQAPIIRLAIAEALGWLGEKKATQTLIDFLKNNNRLICCESAQALGRLGAKEAIPASVNSSRRTTKWGISPAPSPRRLAGSEMRR